MVLRTRLLGLQDAENFFFTHDQEIVAVGPHDRDGAARSDASDADDVDGREHANEERPAGVNAPVVEGDLDDMRAVRGRGGDRHARL